MSAIKHLYHDRIVAEQSGMVVNVILNLEDMGLKVGPFTADLTVEIVVRKFLNGSNDRHMATRALMKLGVPYEVADKTLDNAEAAFNAAMRKMGQRLLQDYAEAAE
jgi:hypothetical protein